jgi:hypothetical protein
VVTWGNSVKKGPCNFLIHARIFFEPIYILALKMEAVGFSETSKELACIQNTEGHL